MPHVYRTQVLHNGQPSLLQPCPNHFHIKHELGSDATANPLRNQKHAPFLNRKFEDGLGMEVFSRTKDDNKLGLSIEDRRFLDIMNQSVTKSEAGTWETPLPFRQETQRIPNNRQKALKLFKSTQRSLEKKPLMKEHCDSGVNKCIYTALTVTRDLSWISKNRGIHDKWHL